MAALASGGAFPALGADDGAPLSYLTWEQDPSTTMVVSALSASGFTSCEWREQGASAWEHADTEVRDFPFLPGWKVSRVELRKLKAGTRYEFRWPGAPGIRAFVTAPRELRERLTFVDGGDVYLEAPLMNRMNALAASYSPLFVVLGGDLAYANADPALASRWVSFLRSFSERLVTPDGRTVPILVAVGNHDCGRPYLREGEPYRPPKNRGERVLSAPYLSALFPSLVERSYRAIDFGSYLSLVLLDSHHLFAVDGEQSRWLAQALAARSSVAHVFPVYHVPAYPSAKLESTAVPELIRKHWVPQFERAGVAAAFEHDSHTFKVSRPIRAGKVDASGIVYFGDGCWGVPPRDVEKGKKLWYIDKAAAANNAHVVTVAPDGKTSVRSVDVDGKELNRWDREASPASTAR